MGKLVNFVELKMAAIIDRILAVFHYMNIRKDYMIMNYYLCFIGETYSIGHSESIQLGCLMKISHHPRWPPWSILHGCPVGYFSKSSMTSKVDIMVTVHNI